MEKNPRVKRALGKLRDIVLNKKIQVGVEDDPSNLKLSLFTKTYNSETRLTEYRVN
jgi:hypothetical protein